MLTKINDKTVIIILCRIDRNMKAQSWMVLLIRTAFGGGVLG